MTATSVVTARITPSKVRKLLSLWERRASRERRSVSVMVTKPLRKRPCFRRRPAACGAVRVLAPNPSLGVTPKQASNFLYLIRLGGADHPSAQVVADHDRA